MSNVNNTNTSFSELITAVREVRDNANRFLESLERFDNIRHEINVKSLNNFIQGILNTDYNEIEEVAAVDTTSTGRQSTTSTIITSSPAFVNSRHPLLAESFSESSIEPTKSPPAVSSISPYSQIETPSDITSTTFPNITPIVTESQESHSESSITTQYPRVLLEDHTTTTTNSATISTSTISFKRPRGRPRKFSNRYASIIDQVVPTKSDRRYSQKNAGNSHITGKSINSSEMCYSDTSDSFSSRSGSADIYSSDDDSNFEKVMNLVRTYISSTRSDVLKDGIYTWKNTRPVFVNEHLVKVKKLFRNNNILSSPNEDDDIVSAFKRIHTSRRSMHLTRQKYVHTNSSSSKSAIINVVDSVNSTRSRGRPPKSSSKGKQHM
ncbi:hypothetical protein C1645_800589 [Glomus cerebriforme]|uniref:Uncharacterized protein n=1 Tax=Glomus cerebriforme TaxID=658196 RepID=A0A397TMV9_9GLOM|nr:hypothetical protein C1645_800589 [Glomus cerebriforme]